MSVATLEQVCFSYEGGSLVLDRTSLRVEAGESVAIVGPSGSGKSTLLAVLGLLQHPGSGSVTLGGEAIPVQERARRAARTSQIAWIFQSVHLIPRRTALDNVALGLLGQGERRKDVGERARRALCEVGLEDKADRPVHQLSGGEAQRVGIARALVRQPLLIIADEPTGQLDQHNSLLTIEALLGNGLRGSGLVVATHDLDVARRCTRTLSLTGGSLVPLS